jgi:hypothetical protein
MSPQQAQSERWTLLAVLLVLVVPVVFAGWLGGLVLLRAGWVRRRWLLAVAAGIVVVHLARLGFDPGRVVAEHFWLYRRVGPGLEGLVGSPSPAGLGALVSVPMILRGLVGFAWLGVPLGLALACLSVKPKPAPEWSEQSRRQAQTKRAVAVERARDLARIPPDPLVSPAALGAVISGDLEWMVAGRGRARWLQFPPDSLNLPRLLVGQPGYGKTFAFLRLVYTYAALGYQVVFVDGKGTDASLPGRVLEAFYQGSALGRAGTRALVYPDEPATMWRGSARDVVMKVLSVWTFAEQHQFFEAVAENGLALAIDVPGAPPVESSTELLARLDAKQLTRLHGHFGTPESRSTLAQITRMKADYGLPGFALRLRSLLRAVGPTLDGRRGFEDADVAVLTVPSGLKRKDASATMRVLLEEFGMYASGRKGDRPCLLIFDEFSALQGGRATAIDLIERLRSTNTSVMLGVQSFEGLGGSGAGSHWEARRIMNACSGGLLLFRSPSPDDFVKLGGSVQMPDVSQQMDANGVSERGHVRGTGRFRVDPDVVRTLVPGEGFYIVGGRAAQVFVAQTQVEDWAGLEAKQAIADAVVRGDAERRRQEGTSEDPEVAG